MSMVFGLRLTEAINDRCDKEALYLFATQRRQMTRNFDFIKDINDQSMVKVYFQVEVKFGSSNFLQICCCEQKNLDQRAATKVSTLAV
ncbi:hypothetical protein P8452_60373 [Trifolium repens]|nr:hypothetical protein P8452_60373 [Trifolium repens]